MHDSARVRTRAIHLFQKCLEVNRTRYNSPEFLLKSSVPQISKNHKKTPSINLLLYSTREFKVIK